MSEKLETRPDRVLEDPGAQAVASLYASSYLSAAEKAGVADAAEELGSFVDDVLSANAELREVLASDAVGRDAKLALVDRVVAPYCSEFFANFVKVLIRHGRVGLIGGIREAVVLLREKQAGQMRVQVCSAKPLSESVRAQVVARLKEKLGFDPILIESVDASLIGGLVIQIGDTVYDSSLRTRVNTLAGRLTERALNEIQSGRDRFSYPEGN